MPPDEQCRRLGVLLPSSNTMVEPDFAHAVPEGVTVHTARAHLDDVTAAAERRMLDEHLPRAVQDLASCRPHVTVFACTSGAALLGPAGEEQLISWVARETGAPAVSTAQAVATTLRRRQPAGVAVLTPYTEELTGAVVESLRERELTVVCSAGMGLTDNTQIGALATEQIVRFASEQHIPEEADLLFVSCTNLRALDARDALEDVTGLPVVTSNSASLSVALSALGRPDPFEPRPGGAARSEAGLSSVP